MNETEEKMIDLADRMLALVTEEKTPEHLGILHAVVIVLPINKELTEVDGDVLVADTFCGDPAKLMEAAAFLRDSSLQRLEHQQAQMDAGMSLSEILTGRKPS